MAKAFFDVDDTLINGKTSLIMFFALWREKQVGFLLVVRWLFWLYRISFTLPFRRNNFLPALAEHSFGFFARKRVSTVQVQLDKIFQERIKSRLIPSTVQALREHQERGDQIILLSGSIYPLLRPLARYLKADRLISTELENKNGIYTGKLKRIVYGQSKFTIAEKEENFSSEGNFFYSNSCADLPCLEQVTYPVVVNPTSLLRKKAQEKGWPILAISMPLKKS